MTRRALARGGAVLLMLVGLLVGGSSVQAAPATCDKVLFVGVRGAGEADDRAQLSMGPVVYAAFEAFRNNVPAGVAVEGVGLDYPAVPVFPRLDALPDLVENASLFTDAYIVRAAPSVDQGVANLGARLLAYIAEDTATCLVLAGYSEGAWVIDEYFYGDPAASARLLDRMTAVLLFGDPQFDPTSDMVTGGAVDYPGIGRSGLVPAETRWPPTGNYYAGQGNRVQSFCTNGDPVCAFEWRGNPLVPGPGPQSDASRVIDCLRLVPVCPHFEYVGSGYTGWAGTWAAGRVQAAAGPSITATSTFTEGVLAFARVSYSPDAVGFGFQGINGSGWARETHPFTSPSFGRVSPGQVEYPFNHACGTPEADQSDIEFWVYDAAGRESPHVPIHLAC
jgi:hypothetical protein